MNALFDSLQQRRRPEDVAEMIRSSGLSLTPAESAALDRAAGKSLKRGFVKYTSMLEDFHRPEAPQRQVRRALELFRRAGVWTPAECADPVRLQGFLEELCPLIGKGVGKSDFKFDRLNGEQRAERGLDLSRRRYNKLFRFLGRFEAKLAKYVRETRKCEFARVSKSKLATQLPVEEFEKDLDSAVFIAYYTARCNLRSVFTNASQVRPYDEIADMLFSRLRGRPGTNWWAVAQVFPDPEVLSHLSDAQKGELLGRWLVLLRDVAAMLKEVWVASDINRETMIVRRGNDSSTWNATAGAWNAARSAWVALVQSMGLESEFDGLCFGKVLRLMAADVAYWHRASGGDLDPNTAVWNDLPLPWEVLLGEASCSRRQVEEACRRRGIDPVKSGWVAPPPERRVEKFTPTPELVHGVAVASPELAGMLRRAGWFSGQKAGGVPVDVNVVRDADGFALRAE